MRSAAFARALIATGWTCAYAFVVWVVPGSFRKVIPYPFDVHAIHLLLDTLDKLGWVVSCVLMGIVAFGGRGAGPESRWGLGLGGGLGIGVCATLQRYFVYARVDTSSWERDITYPMTLPVAGFDAQLARSQLVDLAMVIAGVLVVYGAWRELLPAPGDHAT
jgi:hypothetical protein